MNGWREEGGAGGRHRLLGRVGSWCVVLWRVAAGCGLPALPAHTRAAPAGVPSPQLGVTSQATTEVQ